MSSQPENRLSGWPGRLRLIGTVLSVALLAWLMGRQDWRALMASARALPAGTIALAVLSMFLGQLLNTGRWLVLLRAQRIHISYAHAARLVFAGLFASNFLPTTVGGDVVRLAGVMAETPDRAAGAATVIVDRMVSIFGMLFVLPFSWPLVKILLAGGGASASLAVAVGDDGVWRRLRRSARRLIDALSLWARRPSSLFASLLLSWLGVACYLAGVWITARGLDIPVSYWDVAGATGLTYFMTLVPVSLNGYGVRELGVLAFYVLLGAQPEQAAALALVTRAMLLGVSLPGALWLGGVLRRAAAGPDQVVALDD